MASVSGSEFQSASETSFSGDRSNPSISGPITLHPAARPEEYSVTKSNKLIEGQCQLTARQQKVLAACISLVNPKAQYPSGITIQLTDEQLSTLTGITKRSLPSFLHTACKKFQSLPIETPGKKEGTVDYISIAHRSRYDPETRVFELTFHPLMEEELINLSVYTRYTLRYLTVLSAKYAMRMFEFIAKVYNPKRPSPQYIKVRNSDLMYPLGIVNINGEPLVPSYANSTPLFQQKVLEPCINEINEKTIFDVQYKPYRTGRAIAGFNMVISVKQAVDTRLLPAIEDENESVGRRLAIEGVAPNLIERWINNYGETVVLDNYNYLDERRQLGMTIRSVPAFLNNLLKYNIAHLPDVANPYSSHYSENPVHRAFVKELVMPIWWKLHADLREEIVLYRVFSKHPVIDSYFTYFVTTAEDQSLEEALLFWQPEELLQDWNEGFEKMKNEQNAEPV